MRGKVADENSVDRDVKKWIISAIEAVLQEEDKTDDYKIWNVRGIIGAYDIYQKRRKPR